MTRTTTYNKSGQALKGGAVSFLSWEHSVQQAQRNFDVASRALAQAMVYGSDYERQSRARLVAKYRQALAEAEKQAHNTELKLEKIR